MCNRVQVIHQGRLVFASSMHALLEQDSDRFCVRFRSAVSRQQLQSLDCVDEAQTESDGFIVTLNSSADRFSEAVSQAGWGLLQLTPQQQSLEQVFVNLAHQEQAA